MRNALPICKYSLRDGFPDEYLADHCTGMGGRRTYWKHLGRVGQFRLAQVATRYIRSVHDGVFESASMRTISVSFEEIWSRGSEDNHGTDVEKRYCTLLLSDLMPCNPKAHTAQLSAKTES
jgi:hypothetical protein